MKPWQLKRKLGNLELELDDSVKSETKIDINSLTAPERMLLEKVQEIVDKYAPQGHPKMLLKKTQIYGIKA